SEGRRDPLRVSGRGRLEEARPADAGRPGPQAAAPRLPGGRSEDWGRGRVLHGAGERRLGEPPAGRAVGAVGRAGTPRGVEGTPGDALTVNEPRRSSRVVASPTDGHGAIEILAATDTEVVYAAHTDAPERHLFRAPIRSVTDRRPGDAPRRLTSAPGVHSAVVTSDLSAYAQTASDPTHLPRTTVHSGDGKQLGELPSVAAEPPFQPNVTIQKVGDYWTGIVRPRDFDPKKKYPVLVYVYGGPTSQVVTQAMQPWLVRQWLADQGFIVVAIDNRGTPGRGREWETA